MAKKKKQYSSFTFYSQHSMMRVVMLSMGAACFGVILGVIVLVFFVF